jgi:hypothetical protein
MTKQDYLEMYKFHFNANKEIESLGYMEIVCNPELSERLEKNKKAMDHARQMLKSYFKTYGEDIVTFCEAA